MRVTIEDGVYSLVIESVMDPGGGGGGGRPPLLPIAPCNFW